MSVRCFFILFAIQCSGSSQQTVGGSANGPAAVINEVCFDPAGVAGSPATPQWVELYFSRAATTQGWKLKGASNQLLVVLPALTMPADSYLVVLFGPYDPNSENLDPSQGPVVIMTGQPHGDYLGVSAGGIKLRGNGSTLDKIYWGLTSGPAPFFDLAFATGQPLLEGGSIGRDELGTDTDAASDFAVSGGPNSIDLTPGVANRVELPSQSSLLLYAENAINSALATLSMSERQGGWLLVHGTNPSINGYAISATNPDEVILTSSHVFMMQINGQPMSMSGQMQTRFVRSTAALAASDSILVTGSIVAPGGTYELAIDFSRTSHGAHSSRHVVDYDNAYVWRQMNTPYSVSVSGSQVTEIIGDGIRTYTDQRSTLDFGNPSIKSSSVHATVTRLGDGHYLTDSTINRSFPSLLPYPGDTQPYGRQEQVLMVLEAAVDGLAQITNGTISTFEQSIDGSVIAALQAGAQGSLDIAAQLSGNDTLVTSTFALPVEMLGTPTTLESVASITVSEVNGKEVTSGMIENRIGGSTWSSSKFAIDPPVRDGKRGGWDALKNAFNATLDFVATSGTCVAGGLSTNATLIASKAALAKKAARETAKRLIPGLGWVCIGSCVAIAIGDRL